MSPIISAWQELDGDGALSPGALAYVGQRAKNTFYDFVLKRFRASRKTQAQLARRLGKTPPQISRMLASPANWTIVTAAHLLTAIADEELLPEGESWTDREPRNFTQEDVAEWAAGTTRVEIALDASSDYLRFGRTGRQLEPVQ